MASKGFNHCDEYATRCAYVSWSECTSFFLNKIYSWVRHISGEGGEGGVMEILQNVINGGLNRGVGVDKIFFDVMK